MNGRPALAGRPHLVEERHVPHRTRALLGVHQHSMPVGKHDRVVIRMPYRTLRVQLRVADHLAPGPTLFRQRQSTDPTLTDPRWVHLADENGLAASPDRVLEHVVLPATARERL